jgi:hypothetical protein
VVNILSRDYVSSFCNCANIFYIGLKGLKYRFDTYVILEFRLYLSRELGL